METFWGIGKGTKVSKATPSRAASVEQELALSQVRTSCPDPALCSSGYNPPPACTHTSRQTLSVSLMFAEPYFASGIQRNVSSLIVFPVLAGKFGVFPGSLKVEFFCFMFSLFLERTEGYRHL